MFEHVMTLLMLTMLQAVLGFDNLLYISIESKRVVEEKQSMVRKWGVGLAIFLRIVLLIGITMAIEHFQEPFVSLHSELVDFSMNVHSFIGSVGRRICDLHRCERNRSHAVGRRSGPRRWRKTDG